MKSDESEMPPEKKRKIDDILVADVESKIMEIRQKLEELDKSKGNADATPCTTPSPKQNKKKNKKQKQKNNAKTPPKAATKPDAFDYSNVDFQKFRGGSIKEQQNVQFKSKFHGKVSHFKSNIRFLNFLIWFSFVFRVKTTRQINNSSNR